MKILLISPLPPPVGGIASWTVNILDYYKNQEYIEVIHQNTAIKSRAITNSNTMSRLSAGTKDSFRAITSFYSITKKYKPDVIHMTSSGSMGLWRDLLISLLAKLHSTPIVIHFHFGRISEISRLNNWEWKVLKRVVSFCSAVMVLDDESLEVLNNQGFKNVYSLPNPISKYVEGFSFDDEKFNSTEDSSLVKVIFVGHITKNKGVFELVESCSSLSNIDELVLIGPYEEGIKNELLNISLSGDLQIKFTGALDKESVLAEMRSASMLVLPSYSEGFPNVIIEAMAMKCPVIATDVGAIASMLDSGTENPCGIVIEPKNVKNLAEAINLIITDTIKAEHFRENAFLKVKEQYTLENVCSQYEKVWHTAYQRGKNTNV